VKKWIKDWLDAVLLLLGLTSICIGAFFITASIGFIVMGACLSGLAFFVAKKSAG